MLKQRRFIAINGRAEWPKAAIARPIYINISRRMR